MRAVKSFENIVFQDESVFTTNQVHNQKVWYSRSKDPVMVKKKKFSFKAIAVCAAIDMDGHVVAENIVDKAIDQNEFAHFLCRVRDYYRGAPVLMLVDNLSVHYTAVAKQTAKECNIELCFNGTYSSSYNPIERLWSFSKRAMQKECIRAARYE